MHSFNSWVIFHCVYVPQMSYPFICWWTLCCIHILAIINSAVVNTGVRVSLSILVSLACMPSSGIAGSYDSSFPMSQLFAWGEKTLMLGRIGGRRRRGQQRMRWLDSITDSMDRVWVNSKSRWWTGRPGVPRFMGSQRVRHDWVTEVNWTELMIVLFPVFLRNFHTVLHSGCTSLAGRFFTTEARSHLFRSL